MPTPIDNYIAQFPKDVQKHLNKIRTIIQKAAPDAKEVIKYGIPTFELNGNLIHFAAYKKHIGLYPTPPVIVYFAHELASYTTAKGSIVFPLDKPIPFDLIQDIVAYRVQTQNVM